MEIDNFVIAVTVACNTRPPEIDNSKNQPLSFRPPINIPVEKFPVIYRPLEHTSALIDLREQRQRNLQTGQAKRCIAILLTNKSHWILSVGKNRFIRKKKHSSGRRLLNLTVIRPVKSDFLRFSSGTYPLRAETSENRVIREKATDSRTMNTVYDVTLTK